VQGRGRRIVKVGLGPRCGEGRTVAKGEIESVADRNADSVLGLGFQGRNDLWGGAVAVSAPDARGRSTGGLRRAWDAEAPLRRKRAWSPLNGKGKGSSCERGWEEGPPQVGEAAPDVKSWQWGPRTAPKLAAAGRKVPPAPVMFQPCGGKTMAVAGGMR
jgi:hypothetical protein